MQVISINIGASRTIQNGAKTETTGIFKQAAAAPVLIGENGVTGDYIDDKKHHGGPDQAVYVYGAADYAWWGARIGRELPPGIFGENLTISDLETADLTVGTRLHIGDSVVLEVTAPRIPCATLAARMEDPEFVKKFRHAARPGAYCRVIQGGAVQPGDRVIVVPYGGSIDLTLRRMFEDWYERDATEEDLRLALTTPIAIRTRRHYEERLEQMVG
jgi:MOSC domain-containing protein YiiM